MQFTNKDTGQIFSKSGQSVPGAPWLTGQQEIPPARRKVAKGDTSPDKLSYFLARGLAAVLAGKVTEFGPTVPLADIERGLVGITVESASSPGRHNHCGMDLAKKVVLFPRGTQVTYHLGIIGVCEAILRYKATGGASASDLVTSYGELLNLLESERDLPLRTSPPPGPAAQEQMKKTCAELYYWLFYEDGATIGTGASSSVRLYSYQKEMAPGIWGLVENHANVLTNYQGLQDFLSRPAAPGAPATPVAPTPGRKFRGWQYDAVKRAIELGLNVSLIGPSSTGKSVCLYEACRDDLKLPVFTINALGDKSPKDLIGGYAKNGDGDWHFVPGKIVRAARAANGSSPSETENGPNESDVPNESNRAPAAQSPEPAEESNASGKAIVFVDEAGHLSEKAQAVFLKCMSDDRMLDMSEFGLPDVSLENVVFVFAGNYADQYGASPAIYSLLSRQDVVLDFPFMARNDEIEWLRSETGLAEKVATCLVDIARETRSRNQNAGKFKYYLDPRGLRAWASIVAASKPVTADTVKTTARNWYAKVANLTSTSNADPAEVAELEKIVADFAKSL